METAIAAPALPNKSKKKATTQRAPQPALPTILEAESTFRKVSYDPIEALVAQTRNYDRIADDAFSVASTFDLNDPDQAQASARYTARALSAISAAEAIHRLLLRYGYCEKQGSPLPGQSAGGPGINIFMDTAAPRK